MAKYPLLKRYRGAPASVNDEPVDQWTPEELSNRVHYDRHGGRRSRRAGPCRSPDRGLGG